MSENKEKGFSNTVINWYNPTYGKPLTNSYN